MLAYIISQGVTIVNTFADGIRRPLKQMLNQRPWSCSVFTKVTEVKDLLWISVDVCNQKKHLALFVSHLLIFLALVKDITLNLSLAIMLLFFYKTTKECAYNLFWRNTFQRCYWPTTNIILPDSSSHRTTLIDPIQRRGQHLGTSYNPCHLWWFSKGVYASLA